MRPYTYEASRGLDTPESLAKAETRSFTCFTSTKVQILTQQCASRGLDTPESQASQAETRYSTQFTSRTSTKVQILILIQKHKY